MKREVPCPDDERYAVGLRVKVGLVQEGERALPHRNVFGPGVDVPVSGWIFLSSFLLRVDCTANEGPVRIQYKCQVPLNEFSEMKLLFIKQNYNVLSPSSCTHISVRDLYISRISLPVLLQGNMWTNPGDI
jgi:hypothetical protein